jgi:hypothetical protein
MPLSGTVAKESDTYMLIHLHKAFGYASVRSVSVSARKGYLSGDPSLVFALWFILCTVLSTACQNCFYLDVLCI